MPTFNKMPAGTITPDLERLVKNTKYAFLNIENPRAFQRQIIKYSISVMYIGFEPIFEQSKLLIGEISNSFRPTETVYYSPNCAAILLVGCGLGDIKTVEQRLQPALKNILEKLGYSNTRFSLSHHTYTTADNITLKEFIQQVRNRILGKTNIYLNSQN